MLKVSSGSRRLDTASAHASFLVDASMYRADGTLPRDVYGNLEGVVRTDLLYHYSSPVCAHRWLEVCEDPAYGHRALLERVDAVFPSLIAALQADHTRLSSIELVSLGPGDGSMDERILRNLEAEIEVGSYCGLDFSFELLRRAIYRITHASGFRREFSVQAICGDFTSLVLESDTPLKSPTRLFTLTGLTVGNYNERKLLTRIRDLLRENDYLFLDARIHALGDWPPNRRLDASDRSSMLRSYDLASVRRFVFGPVEVATYATVEDVKIRFDVNRSLTVVPNAINVVIYCDGLDTKMRFTGDPVSRNRLDLAVTTLYRYQDLLPWFPSIGLSPVWHDSVGGIAMFLLKRS